MDTLIDYQYWVAIVPTRLSSCMQYDRNPIIVKVSLFMYMFSLVMKSNRHTSNDQKASLLHYFLIVGVAAFHMHYCYDIKVNVFYNIFISRDIFRLIRIHQIYIIRLKDVFEVLCFTHYLMLHSMIQLYLGLLYFTVTNRALFLHSILVRSFYIYTVITISM